MNKEMIINLLRSPVAKVVTRLVIYGLTFMFARFGIEAGEADGPAAAIGDGIATVICLTVAALIDRWHHKSDRKTGETNEKR